MKKIATTFVLVAASTFMAVSVMAQTDTTKAPAPTDITKTPTDTTSTPDTTKASAMVNEYKTISIAARFHQFNDNFYAITDRELLNSKQYAVKEEDQEA